MKTIYILALLIVFLSCDRKKSNTDKKENKIIEHEIVISEFQSILDAANLVGAILVYDSQKEKFYSNNFEWIKKGKLPASTFKIANSIIALETEVVENDSTLFKWNGEKRGMKIWEQDLTLKRAFHVSCVPCYQEVARKVGVQRMKNYLNKLNYGIMKVDSVFIDNFWLQGDSKINQLEQIDFLQRFYNSDLPISQRTEEIMKRLMIIEEHANFKISGKTGWSIRNGSNNGWFIGYIESQNNVYYFATNVEPKKGFDMQLFPMIRKEVSYKAFEQIDILP